MERGLVTDGDERPVTPASPYVAHLQVRYFREVDFEPTPAPQVEVLYVDDHLVVADKPSFQPVVPSGGYVRSCLLYVLEGMLGMKGLAPAHRLDRGTAGLVLFVRRPEERGAYGGLFAHGRIERIYEALAEVPEEPLERNFEVASRIVRGTPFFRMEEIPGEPNAWTGGKLLSWEAGRARVELRPRSGKKHQLRLHLAKLGWPILGDRLYPTLLPEAPDDPAAPLRLVAKGLTFVDPTTGIRHQFESRQDPQTLGTF